MAGRGLEADRHPDVLDVVFGYGETGAALVNTVDYVMFTGSVNTGRRITVAAAEVAVGLALIVALYRKRQTSHVEDLNSLKY